MDFFHLKFPCSQFSGIEFSPPPSIVGFDRFPFDIFNFLLVMLILPNGFDRFPFDIFNFPLVLLIVPNGFDKRAWVALIASEKPSFTSEPASFTWERASFNASN